MHVYPCCCQLLASKMSDRGSEDGGSMVEESGEGGCPSFGYWWYKVVYLIA